MWVTPRMVERSGVGSAARVVRGRRAAARAAAVRRSAGWSFMGFAIVECRFAIWNRGQILRLRLSTACAQDDNLRGRRHWAWASGSPEGAVGEAGGGPGGVGGVAAGEVGGEGVVEVDAPAGFFVGVGVAGFDGGHAGEHVGFGGAAGGPFLDAEVVQGDVEVDVGGHADGGDVAGAVPGGADAEGGAEVGEFEGGGDAAELGGVDADEVE